MQGYFTEKQAKMILFRSPVRYRKALKAIEKWCMWLYPRKETIELAKILNANDNEVLRLIETAHTIPTEDINFEDYVSLKEAMEIWELSKERLYQITVRLDTPKIKTVTLDGKTLFNKYELQNYSDQSIKK